MKGRVVFPMKTVLTIPEMDRGPGHAFFLALQGRNETAVTFGTHRAVMFDRANRREKTENLLAALITRIAPHVCP